MLISFYSVTHDAPRAIGFLARRALSSRWGAYPTGATKSGRWLEYTIRGNDGKRTAFDDAGEDSGTLKRAAAVDEVARVVQFLSTELGDFVSGEVRDPTT